jgi:hypothetical protein
MSDDGARTSGSSVEGGRRMPEPVALTVTGHKMRAVFNR